MKTRATLLCAPMQYKEPESLMKNIHTLKGLMKFKILTRKLFYGHSTKNASLLQGE